MPHFEKLKQCECDKWMHCERQGAMLDEGFVAEVTAETMQQGREDACAALQYAAIFHLKPKSTERWVFRGKEKGANETSNGMVRRPKSIDDMWKRHIHIKKPGKCTGPKCVDEHFGKWRSVSGHGVVRRVDRQGQVLIWCGKYSGYARQRMWPKLMQCCRLGRQEQRNTARCEKRIQILEDGGILAKEAKDVRL